MAEALERIFRPDDLVASGRWPSKPTGYRWIKKGTFPPGRLYGPNVRGWTGRELAEHDANLPTELKANAMRGRKRGPRKLVEELS